MVARTYHATRWARLRPVVAGGTAPRFSTPLSLGSNLVGWWRKGVGRFESADESDPAATNGDAIQRWSDQSGAGNHLLQTTSNIRPARYDDYVSCFWKTEGVDLQAYLACTLAATIQRTNFSGGVVVDVPCTSGAPIVGFDDFTICSGQSGVSSHFVYHTNSAGSLVSTAIPSSGKRMTIVWSSTAAALKIWVNGTLYTAASPLDADDLTVMRIASFTGGNPKPMRLVEAFVGSRALADNEAAGANAYLRAVAGALGASGKVVVYGDSMTAGCGSDLLLPWVYRTTNRETTHEWRIIGHDGAGMRAAIRVVTAAQIAAMVTTGDVVVVWSGTNDIIGGWGTGAETFTELEAYRTAVQATGAKFIAATLQAFTTNDSERVNFNNALVGGAGYDAKVLLHSAPELDDSADTTYYTDDGVHLKDAGHAAAAALFQTAMASV